MCAVRFMILFPGMEWQLFFKLILSKSASLVKLSGSIIQAVALIGISSLCMVKGVNQQDSVMQYNKTLTKKAC